MITSLTLQAKLFSMNAMRRFSGDESPEKRKKPDGAPDGRRAGKGKTPGTPGTGRRGSFKSNNNYNSDAPRGERPYTKRSSDEAKNDGAGSSRPYKSAGDRPYKSRRPAEGESTGESRPFRGSREDKPSRPWKREEHSGAPREKRFSDYKPSGDRPYKSRRNDEGEGESTGSVRPFRGNRDDKPSRPWKKEDNSGAPRGKRFSDHKPSDERPYKSRRPSDSENEASTSSRPFRGAREDKPTRPWKRDEESRPPRERNFSERKPSGERSYKDSRDNRPAKPFKREDETGEARERRYADRKPSDTSRPKSGKGYSDDGSIRLNKFIANSGICSRREADTLIESGAVSVNGKVVTELGVKVTREDKVQFGGETLNIEKKVYLLLNKPKGYITTVDDPQERNTVMMLVKDACRERIYPVGRLDRNTSGLLLFTNDGDMAKKLTHPGHKVRKVYHVELDKALAKSDMLTLSEGIELEDGMMAVDEIAYTGTSNDKKNIGVVIHSGRNRVVRRLFESLGYEVVKLDRVAFGNLTKKDLPRGRWRFLEENELNLLKMI